MWIKKPSYLFTCKHIPFINKGKLLSCLHLETTFVLIFIQYSSLTRECKFHFFSTHKLYLNTSMKTDTSFTNYFPNLRHCVLLYSCTMLYNFHILHFLYVIWKYLLPVSLGASSVCYIRSVIGNVRIAIISNITSFQYLIVLY